jgi:hypothetical protein
MAVPALTDTELMANLGDDFLAYVCAASPNQIAAFRAGTAVDPPRQAVLQATLAHARKLAAERRPNATNDEQMPSSGKEWEPLSFAFGRFCVLTEAGMTLADSLRLGAGGSLRELPSDDPVRRALWWLARDVWPALLLPADVLTRAFPVPAVVSFHHPSQELLREGLREVREPLRQLYPSVENPLGHSVPVMSTTGTAGALQLSLLGSRLVTVAARWSGWPAHRDGEKFFEQLDEVLHALRQLARWRSVEVPAVVGLYGVKLSSAQTLETALGRINPSSEAADHWPGTPAPDMTVTLQFPVTYERISDERPGTPSEGFWTAWRTFESRIDMVRLAFLLAAWPELPQPPRQVSSEVLDPFFAPVGRGNLVPSFPSARLSVEAEADVVIWARRISDHFHPLVALAIRRTLSAAGPFREPDDGLVDAVIALEALFGTGESEVGFRLQLAVAFLLGDSAEERKQIFDQVGELYDARSRLVHGTVLPVLRLEDLRHGALQLVIRCLRFLFTYEHLLISQQGRGKTIILRGPTRAS